MLTITLFSKQACGLCDKVKLELAHLASSYPHHLTEIDITQDPELFERYRFAIPVLRIGGQELRAPITAAALEAALESASSQED
jgi:hypothetical protein